MHYFRIVPEYWEDRLLKLKACGFNTVETYIAWNMHEPKEGQFSFEGIADIVRFISIAAKLGFVRHRTPKSVHLLRMGVRRAASLATCFSGDEIALHG